MTDGPPKDRAESLEGSGYGIRQELSKSGKGNLNWNELLSPTTGGPGESPGRDLAIQRAKERIQERYRIHGKKTARGSSSSKGLTVSRSDARKRGL